MTRSVLDRISGGGSIAGARLLQALEKRNPRLKDRVAKAIAVSHVKMYRATGGRWIGRPGAPTLLVTITGRKTGLPRTTALFYLPDGDRQVLVASYAGDVRHPQWYLNLSTHPQVQVQIGSEVRQATARLLSGEERARMWPRLVEHWPGYQGYQDRTDRELPVVVLES